MEGKRMKFEAGAMKNHTMKEIVDQMTVERVLQYLKQARDEKKIQYENETDKILKEFYFHQYAELVAIVSGID